MSGDGASITPHRPSAATTCHRANCRGSSPALGSGLAVLCVRLFRYTMVTCGLIMLVGAIFVGIRLASLSARNGVDWGTLWPLYAAALAPLFETALVLGTPVGFALGLGSALRTHETQSAGGSAAELQLLRGCVGLAFFWLVATAALGAYANQRLGAPGRVARGVVRGASEVCEADERNRSILVPIIGARWACSPSGPPRLVGELSRQGLVAKYSVRELEVSEDLAYVDLTELELDLPAARGVPSLHLAVHGARLHGAWPWAKAKRLPGLGRAVYVASLASILGVLVAMFTSDRRVNRRFTRLSVAVVGGVIAWILLGIVDSHETWSVDNYAVVPAGAAFAMATVWMLLGRFHHPRRLACPR